LIVLSVRFSVAAVGEQRKICDRFTLQTSKADAFNIWQLLARRSNTLQLLSCVTQVRSTSVKLGTSHHFFRLREKSISLHQKSKIVYLDLLN
jgi:hypothetical protein